MLKLKKPPEKALIVTAWFLAGLLFALISGIAVVEAHAKEYLGNDDSLTTSDICRDACNRQQTICVESSGSNFDSNYGDENAFAGLKAGCNRDLAKCLSKCGMAAPSHNDPASGATGN